MFQFTEEELEELYINDLTKRMLAAMNLGVYLKPADGHIWIHADYDLEYGLAEILKSKKITINNKIYGGVLEALNVIDLALEKAGEKIY